MAQIALSLMLFFSAGLFFRGALKAGGLNPGFDPAGDLVSEMDFSLVKKDPAEARRLLFATIQRLRELPGVRVGGTWHHVALRKLHHHAPHHVHP